MTEGLLDGQAGHKQMRQSIDQVKALLKSWEVHFALPSHGS